MRNCETSHWRRLVAFLLSLIATIYPARAAARVRPVEMLRDTN